MWIHFSKYQHTFTPHTHTHTLIHTHCYVPSADVAYTYTLNTLALLCIALLHHSTYSLYRISPHCALAFSVFPHPPLSIPSIHFHTFKFIVSVCIVFGYTIVRYRVYTQHTSLQHSSLLNKTTTGNDRHSSTHFNMHTHSTMEKHFFIYMHIPIV
jgi:hypothetical protein